MLASDGGIARVGQHKKSKLMLAQPGVKPNSFLAAWASGAYKLLQSNRGESEYRDGRCVTVCRVAGARTGGLACINNICRVSELGRGLDCVITYVVSELGRGLDCMTLCTCGCMIVLNKQESRSVVFPRPETLLSPSFHIAS